MRDFKEKEFLDLIQKIGKGGRILIIGSLEDYIKESLKKNNINYVARKGYCDNSDTLLILPLEDEEEA